MSAATPRATPAGSAHPSQALPPGTRLAEFEVLSLLGVGGFGMVYQAFDHQLQRFVAIKEYLPAALAGRADGQSLWVRSSSDEQSFQAGLASFVDEARLLARFDHPSLVKVLRFWEANQTAYMAMPLYRGMTLKQARVHMRTPPSEAWLRTLLWSVTSALRTLHDAQTLHRDISPDNIFLQDHGPPVLLDLGAARHAIGGRKHATVLKVNYAPLEQYTDAPAELQQGPWSDLYALGAVVHGCLSHAAPQPATGRALRERMPPLARVARQARQRFGIEYSGAFVTAMAQCLALQPRDRPQSVAALRQAMGLTAAPAGLEWFDFRAQLGAAWVEPRGLGVTPGVTPGVALPASDTQGLSQALLAAVHGEAASAATARARAAADVVAVAAALPAAARDQAPRLLPEHPRRRRRAHAHRGPQVPLPAPARGVGGQGLALWAMAGSAAVLVVAAGLWWAQRLPRQTPESEIITELAEPARSPPPALAPPDLPTARSADAVVRVGSPVGQVPPMAGPAALELLAPAPPRPLTPVYLADPAEACAAVGFWARSMCVHQECQKDGVAGHPVCVESRMRREAQERERQLYGQ
ncbi:MAG: serine/threonine protein kinase [Proteobacteria bacterium]|nr:serine/threonine protein kinase [Pseudomonadota bacterium]